MWARSSLLRLAHHRSHWRLPRYPEVMKRCRLCGTTEALWRPLCQLPIEPRSRSARFSCRCVAEADPEAAAPAHIRAVDLGRAENRRAVDRIRASRTEVGPNSEAAI